jgi:hypothetical protein
VGSMLTMLCASISQRLAQKPFERVSWWRRMKWGDLIHISPKLSEGEPLWCRDESSLATLRLVGLPPDQPQRELAVYWKKPFWQRGWLRCFTAINNKIEIYSYYQRCLSLKAMQQHNPVIEESVWVGESERQFMNGLVNALNREHRALENRLARYAGNVPWMQKNFGRLLERQED